MSRIVELPLDEISRRAEDGHRYVWLGSGTPGIISPISDSRYQHVRARFDFHAVAMGSIFNWGYWGISLYRAVNGAGESHPLEIARFFKGRVYKNPTSLENLERGQQ